MAVLCSYLMSCFDGTLLRYFVSDLEMVTVAVLLLVRLLLFTFHMRCIYIVRSLYFRIFSPYFLITFLSPEIATSITIHIPFSLSRIIMCGLLLGMVLSVATVHSIIRLPYLQDLLILTLVSSYQCSLSNFIPISLGMLKCS